MRSTARLELSQVVAKKPRCGNHPNGEKVTRWNGSTRARAPRLAPQTNQKERSHFTKGFIRMASIFTAKAPTQSGMTILKRNGSKYECFQAYLTKHFTHHFWKKLCSIYVGTYFFQMFVKGLLNCCKILNLNESFCETLSKLNCLIEIATIHKWFTDTGA